MIDDHRIAFIRSLSAHCSLFVRLAGEETAIILHHYSILSIFQSTEKHCLITMNSIKAKGPRNPATKKNLLWITLLTLAMGMVESAVVIYLRELYYPAGFKFPVQLASTTVAITEVIRELATMIMLLAIGMLAGKSKTERFAWFIYSFAIWDISYYLFLYLIIGWPVSLSEWDILFLIPMLWVGPVWAPLLLSTLMIVLALCILYSNQTQKVTLKMREWGLLIAGALIVIIAFCKDYYGFVTSHHPDVPFNQLFFSKGAATYSGEYIPVAFDVKLFLCGCILILAGIGMYWNRNWKTKLR